MLKKHSKFFENLLLLADLAIVALSWLGAFAYRFFLDPTPITGGVVPPLAPYLFLLLPMFFIWPIVFYAFGLYRPRRIGSRVGEIADVAKACSIAALLLTGVTFFVRGFEFSRLVVLYFWVLSTAGLSLARAAFREVLRVARRKGYNLRHAVLTLVDKATAEHLSTWRPFTIEVSVYGCTAETHDRVTGVAGSFDRTMAGVRLHHGSGVAADAQDHGSQDQQP